MHAQELIEQYIRRGARLVRILTLAEGGLALSVFVGTYLLFEIALDHLFGLSAPVRAAFLAALAGGTAAVATWLVIMPLMHSISRLYVAHRVESVFPHFKNSLVTFVELQKDGADKAITRLVAHQAASCFEGVNIDAGLDSARFVRLGYGFVALLIAVFLYSVLVPKSMWTSFTRAMHPWADIPAPTRIHVYAVEPGSAKVLLGSDVPVSAEISGGAPAAVSIRWSRDGELWQALPMQPGDERWHGLLQHVETNLIYYIRADDATSQKYSIQTVVPPVALSLKIVLTPPSYTGLPPTETTSGNITALAGGEAAFTIKSNKDLASAALKVSGQPPVQLKTSGVTAVGTLKIDHSARYSIALKDTEGLSPAKPVEYDITAISDRPPKVAAKGPPEETSVALEQPLSFRFEASDEYGLTRMSFHFESDPSNANVKNYTVPAGAKAMALDEGLTAGQLGARPGDTVSYYLEAMDNREAKPNSARTPTYAFRVAGGKSSVIASSKPSESREVPKTGSNLPGEKEKATGTPSARERGVGEVAPSGAADGPRPSRNAASELLKMLEEDRNAWDVIAKHMPPRGLPSGEELPARASETSPDDARTAASQGSPTSGQSSGPARETTVATGPSAPSNAARPGQAQGAQPASTTGSPAEGNAAAAASTSGSPTVSAESATQAAHAESTGAIPSPSREGTGEGETSPGTGDKQAGPAGQSGPSESSPGPRSQTSPGAEAQSNGASSGEKPDNAASSGASASQQPGPQSMDPGTSQPSSQSPGQDSQARQQSGEQTSDGAGSQGAAGSASSEGASSGSAGTSPGGKQQEPPSGGQSSATSSGSPGGEAAAGASSGGPQGDAASSGSPGLTAGHGSRPAVPEEPGPGQEIELERPASDGVSGVQARVLSTRDLVSRLSADISIGRVNPALLADLGWNPSELRTFVRKYENVLKNVAPLPFDGQIAVETDIMTGEIVEGRRDASVFGVIDTTGREIEAAASHTSDIQREEVAPEYKRIVDEYYRSLAQTDK